MKLFARLVLLALLSCLYHCGCSERIGFSGRYDLTNEGNEFYVGFIRNRFGRTDEQERIPPVLWITTKEFTPVNFEVFTFFGLLASGVATRGQVTYVNIPIGFVVFNSTKDSNEDTRFKGIRIKAQNDRGIVVFGQHEEVASNDAFLALPVISLPVGTSYEYIAVSILGDSGTASQAKDSVALIIGTENDTEIILEPRVVIRHPFAPAATGNHFIPNVPVPFRTVTIQRYQTFYLQVRGGDISGTRIIANKPISVFSGHECANVPLASEPCDILTEQLPPIDTWGTEVVTVPLRTRSGDVLKVFASQDSTTVNVAYTNINNGLVTSDSFTLGRNEFRELGGTSTVATGAISDFALIQSNNPIAVFQFSRSFTTDNNILSSAFMLLVPPCEQYRDSYAVATAPFDPSIEGTSPIQARVAYVNYTNIAVPAEYFNASLITVNNNPINPSEFRPIRRADNSLWGYGAQLLLDEGAQVISHSNPNSALSVTLYGFSNQQSWGCAGGTGLTPIALSMNIPTIAGGQCIPQPEVIPNTDVTVMIGSPAYIIDGFDLIITCNVITGIPPINISWYRNGVVDPSRRNMSTMIISNVHINKDNGVVYTCRAENDEGYDEQLTIVNVFTPLCSHEVCKSRSNILCIIPDSMCLCKPQMGYCSAAYYSTETRSLPERCTRCRIPTDLDCLKTWSQCVKIQDEGAHGRPRRRMRTAANFKIYRHPC